MVSMRVVGYLSSGKWGLHNLFEDSKCFFFAFFGSCSADMRGICWYLEPCPTATGKAEFVERFKVERG